MAESTEITETNEESTPPSVFLTGSGNAVGTATLKRLLKAGHEVYTAVSTNDEANRVRDLGAKPVYPHLDRASELVSTLKMAKANIVVNAEPQTANGVPFGAIWDADALSTNTTALVSAAEEAGVDYFVHVSFAFLYKDGENVDENGDTLSTKTHPVIAAALAAEKAVIDSEVASCVLRAGYSYGPEAEQLKALTANLRAGRPVSAGKKSASWVYAGDLAEAIALTIEKQPENSVLNIADNSALSPSDFLSAFTAKLGLKSAVALPGLNLIRGLFGGRRDDSALTELDSHVSNAKAREALDWEPQYATVEGGLEQVLLAWRAEQSA